jgi:hypothetical protein
MSEGFLKLRRSAEAFEVLINYPQAFQLLSVIAWRAKRTNDFSAHGLNIGEALIGDFKNYSMTEQQYRTSKKRLSDWNFVSFRATPLGTIAKILDTSIYDINAEMDNVETTDEQRASNGPVTTIKNERNSKKKEVLTYDDNFEALWEAYPNRKNQSKFKAYKAYQNVDVPLETMMNAVLKMKKTSQWKKEGGQYVPHLATWIRGRYWESVEEDLFSKQENDDRKKTQLLYEAYKADMTAFVKDAPEDVLRIKSRGDWKLVRLIKEIRPEVFGSDDK